LDQGGELQRLARALLRHPLCRQLAQLVVDQRQQPAGRVRVALTQGTQQLGGLQPRSEP
jgi:hypothetical protein